MAKTKVTIDNRLEAPAGDKRGNRDSFPPSVPVKLSLAEGCGQGGLEVHFF
jgi:hypothetical protein